MKNSLAVANDAFESYCFDGRMVEQSEPWRTDDEFDLTRIIYLTSDVQGEADQRVIFHARFSINGNLQEAYALDMLSGDEVGASGRRMTP
jgi:hypothetical protein